MKEHHSGMQRPSKFRVSIYRGLVGLVIGGVCGGVIGAAALGFTSWLRENPEEPAWVFAGAAVGLTLGITCGAALGLTIGLFPVRRIASDARDTHQGTVNRGAKV